MKDKDKYQRNRKVKEKSNKFLHGVITTLVVQVTIVMVFEFFQTHTLSDVIITIQSLITTTVGLI